MGAVTTMSPDKPLALGGILKVAIPSVLITLLVVLAWTKFGAFKQSAPAPAAAGSTQTTPARAANTASTQEQNHGVRATLKPEGFDPGSATCAAGQVQLVVENVSGTTSLTLRLARANGEVIGDYQLDRYLLKQEVNLQAGAYTLKELNHSSWVLQITAQ